MSRIGLLIPLPPGRVPGHHCTVCGRGVTVIDEHHQGLSVNEAFAGVWPEELVAPSLELVAPGDGQRPDALAYVCINLPGLRSFD